MARILLRCVFHDSSGRIRTAYAVGNSAVIGYFPKKPSSFGFRRYVSGRSILYALYRYVSREKRFGQWSLTILHFWVTDTTIRFDNDKHDRAIVLWIILARAIVHFISFSYANNLLLRNSWARGIIYTWGGTITSEAHKSGVSTVDNLIHRTQYNALYRFQCMDIMCFMESA